MRNITITYDMALKLESYMKNEIKSIAEKYRNLSWKYNETRLYNEDMKHSKRSFNTNYGIDDEYYKNSVKELRIRQYELYIEWKNFIQNCKEQNGGRPYLPYYMYMQRELICFNPSYDNVEEELERLKSA